MPRLTKEARAFIQDNAPKLPPVPKMVKGQFVYKKQPVDGSVLLKSGALDANGKPGIPGVIYSANVLVYEDHASHMEREFKSFGMDGMRLYVELVNDRHLRMQQDVEKMHEEAEEMELKSQKLSSKIKKSKLWKRFGIFYAVAAGWLSRKNRETSRK